MDAAVGPVLRVIDGQGLVATCRLDVRAAAELAGRDLRSPRDLAGLTLLPGLWAVLAFRLATALHHRGLRILSRALWFVSMVLFGSDFQAGAKVGPGLAVANPVGCGFAFGTTLGRDIRFVGSVRLGGGGFEDPTADGFPTVGDGCWFLEGAKVFGPVVVGAGSVIAANTVVTKDVPAGSMVRGIGARVTPLDPGTSAGPASDLQAVQT